VIGFTQLREK
jgi:hypothetical protein